MKGYSKRSVSAKNGLNCQVACRYSALNGKDLISMRKALDMDYELDGKLKERRGQEIAAGQKKRAVIEEQKPILGTVAVSIDAGKVREKLGQHVTSEGKKKYEIGFRDVKVASVSEVFWDTKAEEAYCSNHSYVGAIEHADEFFLRVWLEMRRRGATRPGKKCVFLADGANWIWDRVPDLAPAGSVLILDFFHACEHVSEVCKQLHGEGSEACERQFRYWRMMLLAGGVETFLAELKRLHEESGPGTKRADFLLREIGYFADNRQRMHYDEYRAQQLPVGSGTVVMRTHGGITLFSRCRQDAASSFESALPEGSPRWKEGCRVA
jgi:hypothetical protein